MLGSWCALWAVMVGQAPGADAPPERPRVFVLDFQSSEDVAPHVAQTLTALVTAELTNVTALHVMSGAELRELVELEGERQAMGCDDDGCLAEIAGALGAQFAISGRISTLGEVLVLQLRMMDVRRAVALARVVRNARSLEVFVDQLPAAVQELVAPALSLLGADPSPGAGPHGSSSSSSPPAAAGDPAPSPPPSATTTASPTEADGGSGLLFWSMLGGGATLLASALVASVAMIGVDFYLIGIHSKLGPEDALAPAVYGAAAVVAAGAIALMVGAFFVDGDEPPGAEPAEGTPP